MGALEDGNIPAFQSGTGTLVPSGGLEGASLIIPGVYLTAKSWIGLVRLTQGDAPGHLRVARQVALTAPLWEGGYGKPIPIESTNPDDNGLIAWFVITDLEGMGDSYPAQAPAP